MEMDGPHLKKSNRRHHESGSKMDPRKEKEEKLTKDNMGPNCGERTKGN
jgi:hypothetical protein